MAPILATSPIRLSVIVPPVVMAVLLLGKFVFALSGTLLASAVVFLVIFCFAFFWGCVWLSAAIGRHLAVTRPPALLVVNIIVQFLLIASVSIPVDLAMRTFTWSRMFRDAIEQTAAFLVAYLVYLRLKRQPLAQVPLPAPNNRWRKP